ncbi:MAG: DNA recombination protein RmuC [Rickettsiales bacterium]|nr:DNA recombination protein RmuC [Rickettsiales bacterium]
MLLQQNSDLLFILSSAAALIFMVIAYFNWRAAAVARRRAHQLEVELASVESYQEQIESLKAELQEAIDARIEAEKQVSVAGEKVAAANQRMRDWEANREEMLKASKASILEAGSKMSSKLLEDHKRESEQAKKDSEAREKKNKDELMKHWHELTQAVAKIQQRESQTAQQVETVMRALTNPSGAGKMAEIGLANSLNDLGLQEGRDFIQQFHVAGESQNMRPDVVTYLPQDLVMVIDSKASKFLLDLAEAEGTEDEPRVMKQLLQTTHTHLDALARKQYAEAVAKTLQAQGRTMGRMLNVMYLPSDAMLEKIRAADHGLSAKAERADIILAGPAALAGLLSLARQQIAAAKQDANQQTIIALVREVMDSFATALTHVDGIGRGVKTSADKLDAFARSLNARLLPKLRQLESLGVQPAKNKSLPHAIASYEVRRSDEVVTIDAENDTNEESDGTLAIEEKRSA